MLNEFHAEYLINTSAALGLISPANLLHAHGLLNTSAWKDWRLTEIPYMHFSLQHFRSEQKYCQDAKFIMFLSAESSVHRDMAYIFIYSRQKLVFFEKTAIRENVFEIKNKSNEVRLMKNKCSFRIILHIPSGLLCYKINSPSSINV